MILMHAVMALASALLVHGILLWVQLVSHTRAIREKTGTAGMVFYPPVYRMACTTCAFLLPVGIVVIMFMGPLKPTAEFLKYIALIILFGVVAAAMVAEMRRTVFFDETGVLGLFPMLKPRAILWTEIQQVSYSKVSDTLTIKGSQGRILIQRGMIGSREFACVLVDRLAELGRADLRSRAEAFLLHR